MRLQEVSSILNKKKSVKREPGPFLLLAKPEGGGEAAAVMDSNSQAKIHESHIVMDTGNVGEVGPKAEAVDADGKQTRAGLKWNAAGGKMGR